MQIHSNNKDGAEIEVNGVVLRFRWIRDSKGMHHATGFTRAVGETFEGIPSGAVTDGEWAAIDRLATERDWAEEN